VPPRNVIIVEERRNPSTDFFILPLLKHYSGKISRCNFNNLPSPSELEGATVIIVRYLPNTWLELLSIERQKLHSLIFFMDDDLLDFSASASMPWNYRIKLFHLATRRKRWLQKQQAELWVSTTYLQKKYATWSAKLVSPMPISLPDKVRKIFYHGSASHRAEILWLLPIIKEVLHQDEHAYFEIIGDKRTHYLFKKLPRTTVIHPMSWSTYQHFLVTHKGHIGLAPLLDTSFNRARSYTKFFDITSCGAVGIYASHSPYENIVTHQHNGLLVDQNKNAWVEAILSLLHNDEYCQSLLNNASERLNDSTTATVLP